MAGARGPNVYDYLDYRAFLRDFYIHNKENSRGFSYRAFSKRAQLSSPNHLKRVMDGDRNLTAAMATRFAAACRLKGEEADYFTHLVGFNQAKSGSERNGHYETLTGFRKYRRAHRIDMAHAAYHATWFLPAIREMAARPDFQADPGWIARRLVPPIPVAQAKKALATLQELELLTEDDSGRLLQSEAIVSTGPELHAHHIANYHRTMMQQASDSIDLVPPEDRDISSLTLCLDEDGLGALKERVRRFRRELLELSSTVQAPAQVVQVNFQLFPLSARPGEETP